LANYLGVRVRSILGVSIGNLSSCQAKDETALDGPSGNPASDDDIRRAEKSVSKSTGRGKDPKGSKSRRAVEESDSEKEDAIEWSESERGDAVEWTESERDAASDSDSDIVKVPKTKKAARKEPVLSEYERVRPFNIERNKELLDEIMQDAATEFTKDLQAALPAKKRKTVSLCSFGVLCSSSHLVCSVCQIEGHLLGIIGGKYSKGT
jgi:hypothetical protein